MMRTRWSLALVASLAVGASGCSVLFSLDDYRVDSKYRDEVMADRPLVYWRFGEPSGLVASDELSARDGTYGNGVTLGAAGAIAGDPDTAVTFNGAVDSSVAMPAGLEFSGTMPFSVEVWARQTAFRNFGWVIDHQDYQVPRKGWGLRFSSAHVALERWTNDAYAGPNVLSDGPLTLDTYQHIVATFDGDRLALYIDGALVSDVTGGRAIAPVTDTWRVGRQNCACSSDNFVGSLDELAIYGVALDATRVTAHYTAAGR
ncbi:MAG: domain containing protein [Myxococcales bacterium]|nr:domain containing protein [Myxococcales bacterium]